MKEAILKSIQTDLGYEFQNNKLLEQAFTRKSYAEEHPEFPYHNEELEFYGDAIVNQIVTKHLFDKTRKTGSKKSCFTSTMSAGELTNLRQAFVSETFLSDCIKTHNWHQQLQLSKGDKNQKVQDQKAVRADLFEAIIGAIAVDSGWDMKKLEKAVVKMMNLDAKIQEELSKKANNQSKATKKQPNATKKQIPLIVCKSFTPESVSQVLNEITTDKKNQVKVKYDDKPDNTQWCCICTITIQGKSYMSGKHKAAKKNEARRKAAFDIMTKLKKEQILSTSKNK